MALVFNGTTDHVDATVAAIDTTGWTIAAWVYAASAGESNNGVVLNVQSGGTAIQGLRFNSSSRNYRAVQQWTGTVAVATCGTASNAVAPLNAWQQVVATYDTADKKCRVYVGDAVTAMAECNSYSTQAAGTTARSTGATSAYIGNNNAASGTWDGRLARVVLDARVWSLAEMEWFRFHGRPPAVASLRAWWPLYGSASDARDLSGQGATGTVTGATLAGDPSLWTARSPRRFGLGQTG